MAASSPASSSCSVQTAFRVSRPGTCNSDSGSQQNSFLTAPETPHSEEDAPFKPFRSDRPSLRFKKRHLRHLHDARQSSNASNMRAAGHGAVTTSPESHDDAVHRSSSLPSLQLSTCASVWHAIIPDYQHSPTKSSDTTTSRRWTLPSKAPCTTALAAHETMAKLMRTKDQISPAIITLRRSANATEEPSKLTFFPPPSFGRSRSNFASYFRTSQPDKLFATTEIIGNLPHENGRQQYQRTASISVDCAQPTAVVTAEPALTQVQTSAYFTDCNMSPNLRRCSTKYVSGSSIYEVLWDMNDNLSSGSSESGGQTYAEQEAQSVHIAPSRRTSVAMDKLGLQLSKAVNAENKIPN